MTDSPPLVLVADDDRAVRFVLCEILEDGGFRTAEAADGQQALARCREPDSPDLVLLDLHMPELDGMGFLAHTGTWKPPVPTIVVSGNLDERARLRAAELGALACLAKPFDPAVILEAVRAACGWS